MIVVCAMEKPKGATAALVYPARSLRSCDAVLREGDLYNMYMSVYHQVQSRVEIIGVGRVQNGCFGYYFPWDLDSIVSYLSVCAILVLHLVCSGNFHLV